MKQHRKMFQYVEEMLYSYDRRKGDKSKNKIEYDGDAHTRGFISGCSALRES